MTEAAFPDKVTYKYTHIWTQRHGQMGHGLERTRHGPDTQKVTRDTHRTERNYRSGIHTLILTHVSDPEALLVGAVIGRPAQEQLVTRRGEVKGHSLVSAQHSQTRTVHVRPWTNAYRIKPDLHFQCKCMSK